MGEEKREGRQQIRDNVGMRTGIQRGDTRPRGDGYWVLPFPSWYATNQEVGGEGHRGGSVPNRGKTSQGGNGHRGAKRRGWMRADNKEANFRRQQEGK